MTTISAPAFWATVYVGLKHRPSGDIADRSVAIDAIRSYVNAVGLCVSVMDTQYVYTNGGEPGLAVGLINYLRFPSSSDQIKAHAIVIAEVLLKACKQCRVSIVMPNETLMISGPSNE